MRKRVLVLGALVLGFSSLVLADVSMTDKAALKTKVKGKPGALRAELANGTGSIQLIDGSGLKWFLNTNINFVTNSSASAAMQEASYSVPVVATTIGGGNALPAVLTDAYDGYQSICVSFTGATGPCATGNANYVSYNQTGAAPTADPSCGGRQFVFPNFTTNGIQIQRKVYVPSSDSFARWLNYFTNTTGAPITFNMITSNNLGSDANTIIVTSSNGNAVAETADMWVTTFQNYSGTTSSDPRLAHVFQGPGASVGLNNIFFANADDNPFWTYRLTLSPGQTAIIMNFAAAMPSKAEAASKAAFLAALSLGTTACMAPTDLNQVVNFNGALAAAPIPAAGPLALGLLAVSLAAIGFFVARRVG